MMRMSGGEAIAESLIAQGIDTVFGIPGIQLDNLFDAFQARRDRLRVIHTRHEQGAAYMAMGYAQSTGRPAAYVVVPGPGFLNSLTALADAKSANLPVLAIVGQIPSSKIGLGIGMPHELMGQLTIAGGIVDWARRAEHPAEVPHLIRAAFAHMLSGRRKPAVFEMAPDIMGQSSPVEILPPAEALEPPIPDPELIARAVELLSAAAAPIIMAGGGSFGAARELQSLAERLRAPIVTSPNGRGVVPDDHPLAHHMLSGQELWHHADLVLAVGTRFSTPGLAWGRPELPVIRIDIDAVQITKPAAAAVAIVSSAESGVAAILERLGEQDPKPRPDDPAAVLCRINEKLSSLEPVAGFANALRKVLPRDGILVSDITQFGIYARYALPVYAPRSYLLPGYQATLGWAYPAALGAQVANPDRTVVTFAGDGGFLFNVQELATAVLHRIPVVAIVFNNNCYGNVKLIQAKEFAGRHIATELQNPDFVGLAQSFGMMATRVEDASAFETALGDYLRARAPALIEVPVGDLPDMWTLIKRPRSQG